MTRYKAAAIHLCLSALIGAAVLAAMLLVWYPSPYFKVMGGSHLALLIIGVDVAIGPLLTLAVFVKGKKGLVFDLAVISLLQISALIYGANIMFEARPAYVVYVMGVFRIAPAAELEPEQLAQARHEAFRRLPLGGPLIVGAENPTDQAERETLMFAITSGIDLHQLPKYYVPYAEQRADAAKRGKPLAELRAADPANAEKIDRFLASSGRSAESLRFLPLLAKAGELTVLVDADSGDVVAMLPIVTP